MPWFDASLQLRQCLLIKLGSHFGIEYVNLAPGAAM